MNDLTPEERQKIYQEERARVEIRRKLGAKKMGGGSILGLIVISIVAVLIVLYSIGSAMEDADHAAFQKLTPEQQHSAALKACGEFLLDIRFKTYSELSIDERRMRASCLAK